MVLFTSIVEHGDTVSFFHFENPTIISGVVRKMRLIKIQKLLYVLYYTVGLFWYFFWSFWLTNPKALNFFRLFFLRMLPLPYPTGSSFCLVACFIISVSKMAFKKTLWVYQISPLYIASPIFRKFFNAFFDTLIMKLATKQKLFSVEYDCGSMLKRKESKKV